ncbi:hypothetical protein BegalDRAFT_0315 [Beggiatoa alba B18LD]|uniref:HipA-like kinase domain-containing protein n=1 Tax=Beggiatoa alba B18LD TaxID=395493 RepID=I3CC92_9GAMM|nr:HipA family kinase [Beggiatoa alba]EIJ41235.1 hypothetical protein BegalDRAFT_0315 [Beggiatoa alba B18LD]
MIDIIEIFKRSAQGATQPYICRGSDGNTYFVKGKNAGARSLICEWIAGCLAKNLQLPIAPFSIVNVSEHLITSEEYRALGTGLVFGSQKKAGIEEPRNLLPTFYNDIPIALQQDIFVFDWWIRNMDRTLSEYGGNANLLLEEQNNQKHIFIIDHNLAFDSDFCVHDFMATHIFREQGRHIFADKQKQIIYKQRFNDALQDWENICSMIPHEWWFIDEEQTLNVDFDKTLAYQQLLAYQYDTFWDVI